MKKVKPQFKLVYNSEREKKVEKIKKGISQIQKGSGFGVLPHFMGYGKSYTCLKHMEEGDVFATHSYRQIYRKKKTLEQEIYEQGYIVKGFLTFLGYEIENGTVVKVGQKKKPYECVEIDDGNVNKLNLRTSVWSNNRQTIKDIVYDIQTKLDNNHEHPVKSTKEDYADKRIIELYRHQFTPKIAEEYRLFCPIDLLPTLINIGHINDIVVDEGVTGNPSEYYWGSFSSLSNKINKTSLALSNSSYPQPLSFPKRYGQNNNKLMDVGQDMEFLCQNMTFLLQELYKNLENIHTDKVLNNGVEIIDEDFNNLIDENWLKSFQKFKSLITNEMDGVPKYMIARRKAQSDKTVSKMNHMEDVMIAIENANGQKIRAFRDGGTISKIIIKKPLLYHLQEHSEDNDIFILNSTVGCKAGKKLWTEYYKEGMKEFSKKALTHNDLLSSRKQRIIPDKEPLYTEERDIWENYKFNEGQRFIHFGFNGRDNSNSRSLNINNLSSPRFDKVARFESFVNAVGNKFFAKNLVKMTGKKNVNGNEVKDFFEDEADYENYSTLRGVSLEDRRYMFVNGMIRPNESAIKSQAYDIMKKEPELDIVDKENKIFDQGLIGYKDEIANIVFNLIVIGQAVEKLLRLRDFDNEGKASVILGQKPPNLEIPTMGTEEEFCRWIIDEMWKLWNEEEGWESIGEFLDFANNYFDTQDWKIIEDVSYPRPDIGIEFGNLFKVKSDDDGNRKLDVREKRFISYWLWLTDRELYVSQVADIFDVTNRTVRRWVEDIEDVERDHGVLREV